MIEPAKAAEIAPIITEAYQLGPREQQVTRLVARGMSTAEIAAQLSLSAHTVRDYLKQVFEKVGVTTRGELVAEIFAEHYTEPLHADMQIVWRPRRRIEQLSTVTRATSSRLDRFQPRWRHLDL